VWKIKPYRHTLKGRVVVIVLGKDCWKCCRVITNLRDSLNCRVITNLWDSLHDLIIRSHLAEGHDPRWVDSQVNRACHLSILLGFICFAGYTRKEAKIDRDQFWLPFAERRVAVVLTSLSVRNRSPATWLSKGENTVQRKGAWPMMASPNSTQRQWTTCRW